MGHRDARAMWPWTEDARRQGASTGHQVKRESCFVPCDYKSLGLGQTSVFSK